MKPKDKNLNLLDSKMICIIINGDVNLEDLEEKLKKIRIEMNFILLELVMAKISKYHGEGF